MKYFVILLLFFSLLSINVYCQENVIIEKSNNTSETHKFSDIDSIVIKKTKLQIPVINEISPNKAKYNDTIAILGKNFGKSRDSWVSFGGTKAIEIFWSDTEIKALVPDIKTDCKIYVIIDEEIRSNGADFFIDTKVYRITTTIFGRVIDLSGYPLNKVNVKLLDLNIQTDENGLFLFEDIEIPENRCFIICKKDGYYDATRAAVPSLNGVTEMRLTMLLKDSPTIIETKNGGTAYLNDNAKIVFPANCFKRKDGTVYNGSATISSRFINPNDSFFSDIFPGDSKARKRDGGTTILFSYGFFPVDIKTSYGEDLFIRDGYTAEISFMNHNGIPDDIDTIPSWYFDYEIGMWMEDTEFIRIDGKFVSNATHFSFYNCDDYMVPATIKGRILSCNDNIPLSGVKINAGQNQTTSDNKGYFMIDIPSRFSCNVSVAQPYKSNVINIPAPIPNQVYDGLIIIVDPISALKGTIKNCDNFPLSKNIHATWGIIGFSTHFAKDGIFNLNVEPGYTITLKCGNTIKSINPIDSCRTKYIGDFIVCDSHSSSIIDMVLIPVGRFRMGQIPDEVPLHYVNITKPFYMSNFEVTQGQWKEVFGALPYPDNNQDELPVVQVTWKEAIDFCNYLSDMENLQRCYKDSTYSINSYVFWDTTANGYRLPSEAEWEYACRAGTETDFYTGNRTQNNCQPLDSLLSIAAWYCGNSNNSVKPVGLKLPNSFGLFDMHGNVCEYVWNSYSAYTSEEKTNPIGNNFHNLNTQKIFRGGAFYSIYRNGEPNYCRSAWRNSCTSNTKQPFTGFRVVRNK